MADVHQKRAIQTAIQAFAATPLHDAATSLFACLGYKSDRTIDIDSVETFCQQFDPSGLLNHTRALKSNWQSIHPCFNSPMKSCHATQPCSKTRL